MKLRLRYYPDPALRKVTEPITKFNYRLKSTAEEMIRIMIENQGCGIASPQVGLNISLIICLDEVNKICYTLCNPTITHREGEILGREGCLSFGDMTRLIKRPEKLTCVYQDLEGKQQVLKTSGWLSRVIDHETQHLLGTLFIDI